MIFLDLIEGDGSVLSKNKDIWEVYGNFIIINGINCSPTSPCTALRCKRMVYQWFACIARHSLT